jgi:hypothetical protein
VLISLLTACGQSTLEIGMVETNLPGRWQASYATFTGTKFDTLQAEAGDTLTLEYDVQVDTGTLTLEIRSPRNRLLWDTSLQDNADDTVNLTLEQAGSYTISIKGDAAGGAFALSWELH